MLVCLRKPPLQDQREGKIMCIKAQRTIFFLLNTLKSLRFKDKMEKDILSLLRLRY